MSDVILSCNNVSKTYQQGAERLQILNAINIDILRGQTVAIIGSSGAGKSTLLNLLGGLDTASAGEITVAGKNLAQLNDSDLAKLRNHSLGFVYQSHHLLAEFDARENVAMPLLIRGVKRAEAYQLADAMLAKVGLSARLSHRPDSLSGGERQRVAIARALVTEPDCVLMDEPTGNLDENTAQTIQKLLAQLNSDLNISFIIVTHDKKIAFQQSRVFELSDGTLAEIKAQNQNVEPAPERL
jgi:lipoprotein-releasing system ATP-binding protein